MPLEGLWRLVSREETGKLAPEFGGYMPLIDPDRPAARLGRGASRRRISAAASSSASLLALALLLAGSPAIADGGRGGDNFGAIGQGGAGGTDNPTGAGGRGGDSTSLPAGGGGGGAGALIGGAGGFAYGGPGIGEGGAGGVHGSVAIVAPAGNSTGTNGFSGLIGGLTDGGGGGGGGGGYGAVVTGSGASGILAGIVAGGHGGNGGDSVNAFGGSGGGGGVGLFFTNENQAKTLLVIGEVRGGAGGAGGIGYNGNRDGSAGAGGAGIVGANLSIINYGIISGGLDGAGANRAAAIRFTGGANTLSFGNATSGLDGGIVIETGTLTLDQDTDVTVENDISGAGGLIKAGAGTVVLTGVNVYSGDTLVQSGRLVADGVTGLSAFSETSNFTVAAGATIEVRDTLASYTTIGSLSGAGSVEIGSGATLSTGFTDVTSTFSGTITGAGSFDFSGQGTQILTGSGNAIGGDLVVCACGGSGQLIIRGGSFAVGSDILVGGGTLAVEQGATLDNGTGTLLAAGAVRIDGTGSSVSTGMFALVSISEAASLTVSGGATLDADLAVIEGGFLPVSATVTGDGSRWTIGGGLLTISVSSTEAAAVTVADGGVIDVNGGAIEIGTPGTLQIGNGGRAGTILAAGIVNDGALVANFTDMATLAADVSGAGSLTKRGAGTLTLSGANSYTGGTVLEGGAVSIASDNNLGDVSGALTLNGGVLQVTGTALTQLSRDIVFGAAGGGFDIAAAANGFTVTQSFSGPGGLAKAGAGSLLLAGTHGYSGATAVTGGTLLAGQAGSFSVNSAFTLSAGAKLDLGGFNQTIGSLAGAGTVSLGAGTLTAGGDGSSTSFAGSITGSGGLTKTGAGSFTLTGTNSYSGATTLAAGRLVVNGSAENSVVTVAGGTLGGSGTVGGINVAAGGMVAPGNSIGTLKVSGNVAFGAGSIYQVEVDAAGHSDRIAASGSATLAGGSVEVLAASGNYSAATDYAILTTSGGITGQFGSVSSNLAFLTPSLSYGATAVTLTMTRNGATFDRVAQTRNQGFIGIAAEGLGAGNPVYDALLSATAGEARAGFDLLSGEAHAQAVSARIGESALVREAILSRLRKPLLNRHVPDVGAAFSADLPGRAAATFIPAPQPRPRYVVWGEAVGGQGSSDADGNAAGLSRRTGGALLGADVLLYDNPGSSLRAGLAGGYTQSRFDLDSRLSKGRLESGHAALYAGARFGALRLDGGLAYSWSESDIRRQVQIRGFGDFLHSQRPGNVAQAFAEIGYGFRFESFAIEPFAQLALLRVSTDAGVEQGGPAALRLSATEQLLGFTTLGLRAEAQLAATPFFAHATLGWRHGFGDLTPQALTAFATGATSSLVFAAPIDRDALAAELGLDWRASSSATLGLTYAATVGESAQDHALKGRVEMRF